MKRSLVIITSLLFFLSSCYAQSEPPLREFRAAWIASVVNLDWPSAPGLQVTTQKEQLINMLDELKETGINAVIFQIRPECDALYDSPYEPWSYWLTGQQGQPPSPYYDPLEFAVDEAHKRGMELHAWFNPYRAVRNVTTYTVSNEHVSKQHPEWTFDKGNLRMLDPGIPAVRDFDTAVIMDVVNRYDVDAIHFDDYFYPYEGMTNADDQTTWDAYKDSFTNRADWRRNNVNTLVAMIYDSIQAVKPHVKFGISPFGIWKSGVPPGIVGLSSYDDIYCDPIAWLQAGTIDYLTPQLYWQFGGGQDYGKLLPWWADQMNGRQLIPGQASYRIEDYNWPADELPRQIRLNRETDNVYGSVYFRARQGVTNNPKGFADSLKNNYYRFKALIPSMQWKDQIAPNEPQNLQYTAAAYGEPVKLTWDLPQTASDGDSASLYAVYRLTTTPTVADTANPANIFDITSQRIFDPPVPDGSSESYYYFTTALDRNHNQSLISNIITVSKPAAPAIASPQNGITNAADSTILSWYYNAMASEYNVQIAEDDAFTNIVSQSESLKDTTIGIIGLGGLSTYYWRVNAGNGGGISEYSDAFSFTTGFPVSPALSFPRSGTSNAPLELDLFWHPADSAKEYRLQVATTSYFDETTIVKDTLTSDTTIFVSGFESFKRYYWRVAAKNQYGLSNWSSPWLFRTMDVSTIEPEIDAPLNFDLKQNYPNPFNPQTTIAFSIEKPGPTSLIIYNVMGQKVSELINHEMTSGKYTINFDAGNLSSGIYIYRLINNNRIKTRKMMFIK